MMLIFNNILIIYQNGTYLILILIIAQTNFYLTNSIVLKIYKKYM